MTSYEQGREKVAERIYYNERLGGWPHWIGVSATVRNICLEKADSLLSLKFNDGDAQYGFELVQYNAEKPQALKRPARLIGATYPEDDLHKGDEHFEPCPICGQAGWVKKVQET